MSFPKVNGHRTIEFANPGSLRDHLISLIFAGKKRATAGLLSDYEIEDEEIEHIGEILVVLDSDSKPVGEIQVTRVEVSRFIDVPDEFALAEGEGDLSAQDFRNSHIRFWTSEGEIITDETQVVQVYFSLLSKY